MLATPKQNLVCSSFFYQLNMYIKCVFGHTKHVVLVCCERVSTFVLVFLWRVTFVCTSHNEHCDQIVMKHLMYKMIFCTLKSHNLSNDKTAT